MEGDKSEPLSPEITEKRPEMLVTLLYYGRKFYSSILVALGTIIVSQKKATMETCKSHHTTDRLL